ncbi:MAG TPA: AraC family transcriptional regulator ligand-binding domain-containing protein [Sphingomicrobium sp.]|nr:AraC family transcriptional regulator ligand-binding domain-containing protein [Sphingomicrobium sp.]
MVPHVRAVALTSYLEVASFSGLDPYEMLRRVHISPGMISDPESHIAATSLCKLLEDSAQSSECPTFGLAMAECRTFASLGPLALLLEHLGSIKDVVDALTEYRRHLNDIVILGVEEGGGDQVLRVELLAKFATPQAADLAIGVAYVVLRGASRFRWQPLEVHFSHSEPADGAHFGRFFSVPVRFSSSFNGFTCSRDSMATEWPWANETMASHARRLLTLVPLAPEKAPVTESVMRLISLCLPSGHATLSDIAARMGKSPRTLQRALAEEGRRFADLLNEVRRSLVVQHLSANNCSMTTIAALLGFFSSSSFSRWFLLEFGVAPRVWRAEQLRAAQTNVL